LSVTAASHPSAGLHPFEIDVVIAAAFEGELTVHDAHNGVVVDAFEVIVRRLTVVDHRGGDLTAKFFQPQAGRAVAQLDVGKLSAVGVEARSTA
jgi:hypothetical protein